MRRISVRNRSCNVLCLMLKPSVSGVKERGVTPLQIIIIIRLNISYYVHGGGRLLIDLFGIFTIPF